MIRLGSKVKDSITGFDGIAYAHSTYMYGCNKVCIIPQGLKDGKPCPDQWFDEQRIEVVDGTTGVEIVGATIPLGSKVKDNITGFEGIASGANVGLHEPPSVQIVSQTLHEGNPVEALWLWEDRLSIVVVDLPKVSPDSTAKSGGPQQTPGLRPRAS